MYKLYANTAFVLIFLLMVNVLVKAQPEKVNGVYFNGIKAGENNLVNRSHSPVYENIAEGDIAIVKDTFKVNETAGPNGALQSSQRTASDSSGNFAVVWLDERNGMPDIYIQFYNKNGEKNGNNIKVNDVPLYGNNSPSISANKKGDYIVCWSNEFYSIMIQRFLPDGNKTGTNLRVNVFSPGQLEYPSAAINDDGSFLIGWMAWGSYVDYCFRQFTADGIPVSAYEEGLLNDSGISSIGSGPHTATDGKGNYVIVWSENSEEGDVIYLQKLDKYQQKIGPKQPVSNKLVNDQYFPVVSAAGGGNFFILWETQSNSSADDVERGRIFNFYDGFVTAPLKIPGATPSWNPGIISSNYDSLFIAAFYNGSYSIISTAGNIITTAPFSVEGGAKLIYLFAAPAALTNSGYYLVYVPNSSITSDVLLQKYNMDSSPEGPLATVNDDTGASKQLYPYTYSNGQGYTLVLWDDYRNGKSDIYAQVYDSLFNPVGENLKVNDYSSFYIDRIIKTAASFSDGAFLAVFEGRKDNYDERVIYTQKISTAGKKLGTNQQVTEAYYDYTNNLKVNLNSKNELALCRYSAYGAWMYTSWGIPLNGFYKAKNILKTSSGYGLYYPVNIYINRELEVFAAWSHDNYPESDNTLYAMLFDKNGNNITDTMIIKNANGAMYDINCMLDGKDYAVTWTSSSGYSAAAGFLDNGRYSNEIIPISGGISAAPQILKFKNGKLLIAYMRGPYITGQYYNYVRRTGEIYTLANLNLSYRASEYTTYSAAMSGDNIFLTWSAGVTGTGYDIFAKIVKPTGISFDYEFRYPKAYDDVLYYNYPNPFNASTKIAYEILSYHKVKLAIYDVLGREVKVLVDEYQEKGVHEVTFNAGELPSGVYFYRLDAFRSSVKKLVIVK